MSKLGAAFFPPSGDVHKNQYVNCETGMATGMVTVYRSMVQEEHAKPHVPFVHNVLLGQEETGLDHQCQMTEESSIY